MKFRFEVECIFRLYVALQKPRNTALRFTFIWLIISNYRPATAGIKITQESNFAVFRRAGARWFTD